MTTSFDQLTGEQIIFQTHRKRAWYDILGTILIMFALLFITALIGGAMRLTRLNMMLNYRTDVGDYSGYVLFFAGLIVFSGICDVISRLISEVTLTNRRIVLKGAPNPWNHYELALDEVQRLTPAMGGIRIKQKNRWLSRAIYMANKWEFINAYNDLTKMGVTPIPSVNAQVPSAASNLRPSPLPPASPPTPIQPKPVTKGPSGAKKKCPMCAEQIPVEATTCEYCGANFEVSVKDGRISSKFIEEPSLPAVPVVTQAQIQREEQRKTSLSGPSRMNLWAVILIPTLILAVVVGLIYAGRNLLTGSKNVQAPTRTVNYAATRQVNNVHATMTAQTSWTNSFGTPILYQISTHAPNFEDDFSDMNGRFVRWNSRTESGITFADGVMRMEGTDWHGAGGSMIATNFVLSFDVTPLEIGSGSAIVVNFRSENDEWYNFYCNLYDSWCEMGFFIDGEYLYAIDGAMTNSNPEQRRNILVMVKGNEFAYFINAKPFAYVRDSRLHGDWVDIGLWSSPGSSEIELDNVKFWDLDNLQ